MSWCKSHECCVDCGDVESPHMAKGLCRKCYLKRYSNSPKNKARIEQKKREWYFKYHTDNLLKRKAYREERHYDGLRERVLARDGRKCTKCGSTRQLTVHHKDGEGRGKSQPNNDMSNLATLCRKCHIDEHRDELYVSRRENRQPQLNKHGRWSMQHDCCIICESNLSKHAAKGVCVACYGRKYR